MEELPSGGKGSSLPVLAQELGQEHPSSLGSMKKEQMKSLGGGVI